MKINFTKALLFFTAIFATAFSSFADFTNSPENFSPHFSTNTGIIWQAATNDLPKSFWIYKRLPPHPFSATVISNAIVLASLQTKGFPKPSTNDFYIPEENPPIIPVRFLLFLASLQNPQLCSTECRIPERTHWAFQPMKFS
jgi:hypothetical protein